MNARANAPSRDAASPSRTFDNVLFLLKAAVICYVIFKILPQFIVAGLVGAVSSIVAGTKILSGIVRSVLYVALMVGTLYLTYKATVKLFKILIYVPSLCLSILFDVTVVCIDLLTVVCIDLLKTGIEASVDFVIAGLNICVFLLLGTVGVYSPDATHVSRPGSITQAYVKTKTYVGKMLSGPPEPRTDYSWCLNTGEWVRTHYNGESIADIIQQENQQENQQTDQRTSNESQIVGEESQVVDKELKITDDKIKETTSEDDVCKVCYENVKKCVANPCGHFCVCYLCSQRMKKECCVCKKDVDTYVVVYSQ